MPQEQTHTLLLALGSNLGNRKELLHEALRLIELRIGHILSTSSFLETEPWGFESKNKFLNAVCALSTPLSPEECLEETRQIEKDLGRKEKSIAGTYKDRTIDLDLLTYDHIHIKSDTLTLPHPHMTERDFVMIPLKEVMEQLGMTLEDIS